MRAVLPDLLAALDFRGTEAAAPVLKALEYVKGAGWNGRYLPDGAPLDAVGKGWGHLLPDGHVNGDAVKVDSGFNIGPRNTKLLREQRGTAASISWTLRSQIARERSAGLPRAKLSVYP